MAESASPIDFSGSTSSAMVRGIRVGDSAAWKRMTAYYSPLVYSWYRRGGLGPEDAADLVQETFLAVWRGLEGFQREQTGQTFRGWLRVITRNKIADHFRGKSRRPPTVDAGSAIDRHAEDLESSADQPADCSQFQRLFERAMQTIRPEFETRTWQAFMLSTLQKRSAADIAQELGVSPGAVRQAKYSVLRRLRGELGDCHPG